jgi:hypothetical protein
MIRFFTDNHKAIKPSFPESSYPVEIPTILYRIIERKALED